MKEEQILVRITGQDRPGLTADIMSILAKYDAQILDIGQADIHATLSLGILIRMDDTKYCFSRLPSWASTSCSRPSATTNTKPG